MFTSAGEAASAAGLDGAQQAWASQMAEEADKDTDARPAWSPQLEAAVTAFWRRRGISDEGVARCLALAQQQPEHRDLALLKERMAAWDEVQCSCPRGVDVNRLIRNDSMALTLEPALWLGRARILSAAYPDVDWYRLMEEHPRMAAMQHWELSHALNDWAARLTWPGEL